MELVKMKKIAVVLLFSLTIVSLPTCTRCKPEGSNTKYDENHTIQSEVETSWKPINISEIQIDQQNHTIYHSGYANRFFDFTDLDPLSAASSAQEYVEKAIQIQNQMASKKSDTFPAHSFVDYSSVHKFSEPKTKKNPTGKINLTRNQAGKKIRNLNSAFDEKREKNHDDEDHYISLPSEKIIETSEKANKKSYFPNNADYLIENHHVEKKPKANYFLNTSTDIKRIRPKKNSTLNISHMNPISNIDDQKIADMVADWTQHFKNVKSHNHPESTKLNTKISHSSTTTTKPKKRIRLSNPELSEKVLQEKKKEDNSLKNAFKHDNINILGKIVQSKENEETAKYPNHKMKFDSNQAPIITNILKTPTNQHLLNEQNVYKDIKITDINDDDYDYGSDYSSKKIIHSNKFVNHNARNPNTNYLTKSKTVENPDHSTTTNYYYEPTMSKVIEEPSESELDFYRKSISFNRTFTNSNQILRKNLSSYELDMLPGDDETIMYQQVLPHKKNNENFEQSSYQNTPNYNIHNSNPGLTFRKENNDSPKKLSRKNKLNQFETQNETTISDLNSKTNIDGIQVKPHTPWFHDSQQKKNIVYYSDANVTAPTLIENKSKDSNQFKAFFSSTVASIIENSMLKPVSTFVPAIDTDKTERSLMTFSPDYDEDSSSTAKVDDNGLEEKDVLEAAESGKNQYVVLYEYDAKPKRKPRPPLRPKITRPPQLVNQEIHYHHHGNPNTSRKPYSQGGSYAGTKNSYNTGNEEDDDGPDVTHTHHEYVHFDNDPAVTHLYNNGPMTDHYNVANPGSNAIYDLKSARDYDFRHGSSHNLDTRHVPVENYDSLRYSHMLNSQKSGRIEHPERYNAYGEVPYYYYDSERQSDLYDLEAYGSSPQQSVVKPFESDQIQVENQQSKLKITDPLNPTKTIEITKDEYVKHVKLAVEKYLKSKEQRTTITPLTSDLSQQLQNHPTDQHTSFVSNVEKPLNTNNNGIMPSINENEATIFVKAKPDTEFQPPLQGFYKPLEHPLGFEEGHTTENKVPLNDDTYRQFRENLENTYVQPIKPITLPPMKINQLTRPIASTPSAFQMRHIPSIRPRHPPPNFNIMKNMRYPKNTFPAGKPLQDQIYNLQENMGNDISLTKSGRHNTRPLDMAAIDVGQSYIHGTTNFDGTNGPINGNFPSAKLKFNPHIYNDINSLQQGKQNNVFKDSEVGFSEIKPLSSKKNAHDDFNIAQNSASLDSELAAPVINIINGVPVSNPYNIDMDTLRFMLGGMPQGMSMTKDPNDPFNMQTLKSIPNIASVGNLNFPTSATVFQKSTKPVIATQQYHQVKQQKMPHHKQISKAIHHHPNYQGFVNHNNIRTTQNNAHSNYNLLKNQNSFQNKPHHHHHFKSNNQQTFQQNYRNPHNNINFKNFNIQRPHSNDNRPINHNNPNAPISQQNNVLSNNNMNNFNPSLNSVESANNNNNNYNGEKFNENNGNIVSNSPMNTNIFGPTNDPEFNNMNVKWNHFTLNTNPFNGDASQMPTWLRDNTNVNSFNAVRTTQQPQMYLTSYRKIPNHNNVNNNNNNNNQNIHDTSNNSNNNFRTNSNNSNDQKISSKLSREPETNLRPPPRFRRKMRNPRH